MDEKLDGKLAEYREGVCRLSSFRSKLLAVLALVTFGSTNSALAFCASGNLADRSDPGCVDAQRCQRGILDAVRDYTDGIQSGLRNTINANISASTTTAYPFACVGGPRNNSNCQSKNVPARNGVCTGATSPKRYMSCDSALDCVSGSCDRTQGCNNAFPDDTFECQPKRQTGLGAKTFRTEKISLHQAIFDKCQASGHAVDIEDIGLDLSTACPQVATALGSSDESAAYEALVNCLAAAVEGDLKNAKVFDLIMRPISRAVGITKPQAAKTLSGQQAADPLPREMVRIAGSRLLQIGAKSTDDHLDAGGAAVPLSFAHCSGGNGAPSCLNNSDCNSGACVRDTCSICFGGGHPGQACTTNADCPGGGTCVASCFVNNVQFKGYGDATRGPNNDIGDIVSVTQTCASPALPVCLVTRARNAGNGTPAMGQINLQTGGFNSVEPTETVYIIGVGCPICGVGVNNGCGIGPAQQGNCAGFPGFDAGPGANQPCTNRFETDVACPPTLLGNEPKVRDQATLTTANVSLSDTLSNHKLCGFCDSSPAANCQGGQSMCATGCQTVSDCPAGATVCDFGTTPLGFHGDTTVSTITASGDAHPYAPTYVGLFCSGITGSPAVDPAIGLPGPVRSVNPYVNLFIFSKDL